MLKQVQAKAEQVPLLAVEPQVQVAQLQARAQVLQAQRVLAELLQA
jgi:hypothetical protein